MYNAKLTKIQSVHSNLRTEEMVGEIADLPKIGLPVIITNDQPLEFGSGRIIWTTNIVTLKKNSDAEYEFTTKNSTYKLEILGKISD